MNRYKGPYLGAYNKGKKACKEGVLYQQCPYGDLRTHRGSVTFSRAFIHAWQEGWYDQSLKLMKEKKRRKKRA